MIRLTCTNCKATLEMDDAFAGGVCRCQYCGTIQTVPSHLKASAKPATAKTLYQSHASPGPGTGTGLDELADIVASSGLGTGLQNRQGGPRGSPTSSRGSSGDGRSRQAAQAPPAAPAQPQAVAYATPRPHAGQNKKPMIIAGAAGAVVLCGLLGWLLFRSSSKPNGSGIAGGGAGTGGGTGTSSVSGPRFVNLSLPASRVVYVIDCGSSSQYLFDPLKNAVYQSIKSLGPEREFQVIFWKRQDGDDKPLAFPEAGVARATPDQIAACQKQFEDLTAGGSTRIDDAIQLAIARDPGAIVIATAKHFELDDSFVQAIENARGNNSVKIHTIDLGGSSSDILKSVAEKSGGRHVTLKREQLEAL